MGEILRNKFKMDGKEEGRNKDLAVYAYMCTMRLNAQLQQYYWFAYGQSVFGRAPKFLIGTADNARYKDSIYPNNAHFIQTMVALVKIRGIPKGSSHSTFRGNSSYL